MFTRIQAMLLSVNVAPREALIRALRERAVNAEDEIERAVAGYVLASTTMQPSDINALLDALLHSPRSVGGLRLLENRLLPSYGNYSCKFLNRLAFIPEHTHKATCALIAASGYSELPEQDGLVIKNGLTPTEEQFEYGRTFNRFNESHLLDGYDEAVVHNRLLALMNDSPDKDTRVTIYLMRLRFPVDEEEEAPVDEALYAKLMSGSLDKDEAHILRYSLLKWRDGRQLESIRRREEMEKDYIASLPTVPEDIEKLLDLERRTYREFGYGEGSDNIASSVRYGGIASSLWSSDILTGEALEKLQAFLRHGKKFMHEADYGYLSDLAERTEAIPEPIQKTDQAGVFVFTGYPNRYSFAYSEDGVRSASALLNVPPTEKPDITIDYADGENITAHSRPLDSTGYGGVIQYSELDEIDASMASCKKFAAEDSFFGAYYECAGNYIAYKMAKSYGLSRLFEVRYSPVDGANMDAFLNTLRTFKITGSQERIWHWLTPPCTR
jgi:hypothetical protein